MSTTTVDHTLSSNLEKEIIATELEGLKNGLRMGIDLLGPIYTDPNLKEKDSYILGGRGWYNNFGKNKRANTKSLTYKLSKVLGFSAGVIANYAFNGIPLALATLYNLAMKPKKNNYNKH